jgi:DNA replication protein DnaC
LHAKPLAGTGVWRSPLREGICSGCMTAEKFKREEAERAQARRGHLVRLLGGEKPYREFTFDRYRVNAANQLAVEKARAFDPSRDNLYFWGACGVGKTHLTHAIARRAFEQNCPVEILKACQIIRRVRMKDPETEQAIIDQFVQAAVLVLDDFGTGTDSPYARQILREILDAREFEDRKGLIIATSFSLDQLAAKFGDDAIPSRLAGMCQRVAIGGPDQRLARP